jgi:uncharacterized protein
MMLEKAQPLLDPFRLAQARRDLHGSTPVAAFSRLHGLLADSSGTINWTLQFLIDALDEPVCDVSIRGTLKLNCQRSLDPFEFPVALDTRLALVRPDADESALRYDPLVVEAAGVRALDVVEDELILAIPLVPVAPDSSPIELAPSDETASTHPFSVLAQLKPS